MFDIKIVAPVRYIDITGINQLMVGHFLLTKNPDILNALVYNQEFLTRVGLNNMTTILSNYNFYYQGRSSDINFLKDLKDQNQITNIVSKFIRATINNLWFVKNNNCFISDCFIQFDGKEVFNVLGDGIKTDNKGEIKVTTFNLEELTQFIRSTLTSNKLLKIDEKHSAQFPVFDSSNSHVPNPLYSVPYDHDRILRAMLFIQKVQFNGFTIIKITFYIAAFEALFSSSKDEIMKSVSERVSIFTSGSILDFQNNVKLVKRAYDIRSKYIHGDIVKKTTPSELVDLCELIDNLARQIFLKILDESFDRDIFKLSKTKPDIKKFDEYFDVLLNALAI